MKEGPGEGEAVRVERRHIYEKVPTVTVLKTYTVGKKKPQQEHRLTSFMFLG